MCFQPVILDEIIQYCRNKVKNMLEDHRIGPELSIQDFDEYIHLINGDVSGHRVLCICMTYNIYYNYNYYYSLI